MSLQTQEANSGNRYPQKRRCRVGQEIEFASGYSRVCTEREVACPQYFQSGGQDTNWSSTREI